MHRHLVTHNERYRQQFAWDYCRLDGKDQVGLESSCKKKHDMNELQYIHQPMGYAGGGKKSVGSVDR